MNNWDDVKVTRETARSTNEVNAVRLEELLNGIRWLLRDKLYFKPHVEGMTSAEHHAALDKLVEAILNGGQYSYE